MSTHSVSHHKVLDKLPASWLYSQNHLPQGAHTSPALADLLLYKLDTRLTALAKKAGLRYTRYADDIALSSATKSS